MGIKRKGQTKGKTRNGVYHLLLSPVRSTVQPPDEIKLTLIRSTKLKQIFGCKSKLWKWMANWFQDSHAVTGSFTLKLWFICVCWSEMLRFLSSTAVENLNWLTFDFAFSKQHDKKPLILEIWTKKIYKSCFGFPRTLIHKMDVCICFLRWRDVNKITSVRSLWMRRQHGHDSEILSFLRKSLYIRLLWIET